MAQKRCWRVDGAATGAGPGRETGIRPRGVGEKRHEARSMGAEKEERGNAINVAKSVNTLGEVRYHARGVRYHAREEA